jgi:ribonuclease BN (tRNA processing enzyme)
VKSNRISIRSKTPRATLVALGLAILAFPYSQAQTSNKSDDVLITLGTAGGPVPRHDRAGISTLVQINGKSYLFDTGDGFTRQLEKSGVSLLDIQNIFLTHLHDDHYAGLGAFIGQLWTLKPRKPIGIYGPPLTAEVVKGAIAFQSINGMIREVERKFPQSTDIFVAHEIGPGEIYKDENVKITATENTHFHFPKDSPPAGRTMSLSYKVETPSRVIVITGDTGAFKGLAEFSRGADIFVTEVIDPDEVLRVLQSMMDEQMSKEVYERRKFHMEEEHMTPESIANLASDAQVKKVILTHFPPRKTGDQSFEDFAQRVRHGFSGKVESAKDLDHF